MNRSDLSEAMLLEIESLTEPLSEEIRRIVWAFPDKGRKNRVHAIAFRVAEMERELEQFRRDAAREHPGPPWDP